MSRAFVKEPDGDSPDDEYPESPVPSGPNYVTPAGLADLQARLARAQSDVDRLRASDTKSTGKPALARARAEVRRWQRRLDAAVLVEADTSENGEIAIGMQATIELPDGIRQTFAIVGEDEADPVNGLVSWASPLGEALLGKRAGETALWRRPAGDVAITIVSASARP
jgi:transcription elongation factor GreB